MSALWKAVSIGYVMLLLWLRRRESVRELDVSQCYFTSFIHPLLLDFRPEDFIDTESPVPPDPEQPDCTKILELPYSIHAFQHLRVSANFGGGGAQGYFFLLFGLMLIKSIFLSARHLIILPTLFIS